MRPDQAHSARTEPAGLQRSEGGPPLQYEKRNAARTAACRKPDKGLPRRRFCGYDLNMAEKSTKPTGIRIQLKGLRTTQELRAMLHEAIDRLEALGITHLRGSNLYVTPADKEGNPVFPREHRRKINSITIEEPYRSVADEHGIK